MSDNCLSVFLLRFIVFLEEEEEEVPAGEELAVLETLFPFPFPLKEPFETFIFPSTHLQEFPGTLQKTSDRLNKEISFKSQSFK